MWQAYPFSFQSMRNAIHANAILSMPLLAIPYDLSYIIVNSNNRYIIYFHKYRDILLMGGLLIMKKGLNKQLLNALIDELGNEDPMKRAAAARQLGNLNDEQAIHSLVTALQDSKWAVRKEAAYSILDICKGSEKHKNLIKLLKGQIQAVHSSYERFNNYLDEYEYFESGIGIDIEEYYKNGIRR